MSEFRDKKILVGITGGIAAYKAAMLVRLLVKEGAEVQVLMTPFAKAFITPLTLSTLSKRPVMIDFYDPETGAWNSHVDLGQWADLYVIAPATANSMGKMAHGIADNLLLATYLCAKCQVLVAPAMDLDMYQHPANLKNVELLRSHGNAIIEADSGELASGLTGKGRMKEPEDILEELRQHLGSKKKLTGKRFLVTAGPTYENLDPVRFLGNYSSGKMGYALAETLAMHGAEVDLVSGPTHLTPAHPNIRLCRVQTAEEMYQHAVAAFENADGAVLAAAVSDFKPVEHHQQKVKRGREAWTLKLEPTPDIAQKLGRMKTNHQLLVGFALETQDELAHARKKIHAKNLNWIVLNSLKEEGAGFQVDTNKITIIDDQGQAREFELKSKQAVAEDIVNQILTHYEAV